VKASASGKMLRINGTGAGRCGNPKDCSRTRAPLLLAIMGTAIAEGEINII